MKHSIWAIVPAAGVGKRMQSATPKQYLPLNDRPVIEHTVNALLQNKNISGLVIALQVDDAYWSEIKRHSQKPLLRTTGGNERADSVLNAINELFNYDGFKPETDWVMVHDAVRPCLRQHDIDKLVSEVAQDANGGLLALPVRDTMKRQLATTSPATVEKTVDRENLWHALTPQYFPAISLKNALQKAQQEGLIITDESSAMEQAGFSPKLVQGYEDNIKITRPDDLRLASLYLQSQETTMNSKDNTTQMPFRIGHGYDVHRFGEGDFIVLGGAKIAHHSGFIAHSDGDVLIHALCDALLGAIAAGDIGQHFPDNDAQYKNINSTVLLEKTNQLVNKAQYVIANIDLTIVAQTPKMATHIPAMLQRLAEVLNIDKRQINIKATTTETLGFTGREEGVAVHAVAMLYRKPH